jgi:hypothetical protein
MGGTAILPEQQLPGRIVRVAGAQLRNPRVADAAKVVGPTAAILHRDGHDDYTEHTKANDEEEAIQGGTSFLRDA